MTQARPERMRRIAAGREERVLKLEEVDWPAAAPGREKLRMRELPGPQNNPDGIEPCIRHPSEPGKPPAV